MRLSIEPIRPRFRGSLVEHLGRFGLSADVVEWKYFRRPWPEALSGLVWLKDGRVRASLGLIPFEVNTGDTRVRASWTCDWVVDSPRSNPGVGVMLLQHARSIAGPLFSLGGNELNRQLMPRIATEWRDNAALELYLPLRMGGNRWFRGLNRRTGGFLTPLAWIPQRRVPHAAHTSILAGVSSSLAPLLDTSEILHPRPVYTVEYLRWQLELCPGVEVWSVWAPPSEPVAAAVCWSRRVEPRDWRFALWGAEGGENVSRVLDSVVAHVYGRGGWRLSVLGSRLDSKRLELFQQRGFSIEGTGRPLYITASPGAYRGELAGLSFLDTDLAYRL